MSLVRASGLTYVIGGKALVNRVDFDAERGTLIAVCGPNGAGKSTLLRMLSGEARPTGGRIDVDGMPLSRMTPRQLAAKRAVMPQYVRLAFPFSAFEVTRLGADGIGAGISSADRDRFAREALAAADAAHLSHRNFQTLSGGEQQRVSYARALAQLSAGRTVAARQFLLLDEPTASLDLRHQIALLGHARSLARDGMLVIAVMHDLMLARSFADRIYVMHEGAIAAIASAAAPLSRPDIERIFGVSIGESVCPPSPWRMG